MSTSFSSLPIISLSALSNPEPGHDALAKLSLLLDEAFCTTGFAYLTDLPLTYTHADIFNLCDSFFGSSGLTQEEKMELAKKTFVNSNRNTYRGYFPPQAGSDNLKEGFELGTGSTRHISGVYGTSNFDLTEPNVFPEAYPSFQKHCETLHSELQSLASKLLSLLAVALGKPFNFFDDYLTDSLSTLRLLHYPLVPPQRQQELICTPHTDSGILTLLHQDQTGGLEVQNSIGQWISAPYLAGSLVVNIGDLLAKVSAGRWVATYHRVRSAKRRDGAEVKGRYSVPFFFEPGMKCAVRSVEGDEIVYGEHVLEKMRGWVEFQDAEETEPKKLLNETPRVEVF